MRLLAQRANNIQHPSTTNTTLHPHPLHHLILSSHPQTPSCLASQRIWCSALPATLILWRSASLISEVSYFYVIIALLKILDMSSFLYNKAIEASLIELQVKWFHPLRILVPLRYVLIITTLHHTIMIQLGSILKICAGSIRHYWFLRQWDRQVGKLPHPQPPSNYPPQ